jgi:glycosyltransferase involved in cell wall biosynthesis
MATYQKQSKRHVVMYAGYLPINMDSGAEIRLFTNIRAYQDLDFDIEFVYVGKSNPSRWPDNFGVTWRYLSIPNESPTMTERLAFRVGWPFGKILNYRYEARKWIQRDVLAHEKKFPGTLYHFEYLFTACAAINLPGVRTIFSSHDLESARKQIVTDFRTQNRKMSRYEMLSEKYVSKAEKFVVKHCQLVLAIATHEAKIIQNNWSCDHVELFPMSWPDETIVFRKRNWMDGKKLRLLHLGKIDTLLCYNSLKFLFTEVFPRLEKNILQNIEMDVVGKIPESEGAKRIIEMAKEYPQVKFHGFQRDTRSFYGLSDLQVVGATIATGLRTRIIESFVFGIPVISTMIGAQGVEGLISGKNIFLAKDAQSFVDNLTYIYNNPACLPQLAKGGRETYDRYYNRNVAATILSEALDRHIFRKQKDS